MYLLYYVYFETLTLKFHQSNVSINFVNIQTMFHRKLILFLFSFSGIVCDRQVKWLSWIVFHSQKNYRDL